MSWQHLNQPQGWIGVISLSLSLSVSAAGLDIKNSLIRPYSLPLCVGLDSCLQTCYVCLLGCVGAPRVPWTLNTPTPFGLSGHVGCQG